MEQNTENLIEKIRDIFEEEHSEGLTEEKCNELAAFIPDDTALSNALPALKMMMNEYKGITDKCDGKIKDYTDSKKMWKNRTEQIVEFVGFVLKKLGHKSYSAGDAKASFSTREVLEISDEDALLDQYLKSTEFAVLRGLLPGWVKVSLTIDKTALKSFVKTDSTLLVNHPEWIHTKENITVNLK